MDDEELFVFLEEHIEEARHVVQMGDSVDSGSTDSLMSSDSESVEVDACLHP